MVLPFEIVRVSLHERNNNNNSIIPCKQIVDTALSMIMLSAFGIMIVARHQLLIEDGSALKMRLSMKYGKRLGCTFVIGFLRNF